MVINPCREKNEAPVPATGLLLINPFEAQQASQMARKMQAKERFLFNSRLYDVPAAQSGESAFFVAGPSVGAPMAVLTLEKLIAQYGINLVFVEGGTGDDSLSFLRDCASEQVRRRVARRFLERGEIAGEEYLDIVSDHEFSLWGVEDPDLYREAIVHYENIAKLRARALRQARRIREVIRQIKEVDVSVRLREVQARLDILVKYFMLSLKPDEFRFYGNNREDFHTRDWVDFLNARISELGMSRPRVAYRSILDDQQERVGEFYRNAERRDLAFVARALSKMREEGCAAAVLICGGYHTPRLSELFRRRGISYVVLSPHVTGPTDRDAYERILLS